MFIRKNKNVAGEIRFTYHLGARQAVLRWKDGHEGLNEERKRGQASVRDLGCDERCVQPLTAEEIKQRVSDVLPELNGHSGMRFAKRAEDQRHQVRPQGRDYSQLERPVQLAAGSLADRLHQLCLLQRVFGMLHDLFAYGCESDPFVRSLE